MPDLTKYDILLNELLSIESQLAAYKNKSKNIFEKNKALEKRIAEVTKENKDLKQKVDELMELLEHRNEEENLFGSVNSKEKEALKAKIRNLISRIDYHLSS